MPRCFLILCSHVVHLPSHDRVLDTAACDFAVACMQPLAWVRMSGHRPLISITPRRWDCCYASHCKLAYSLIVVCHLPHTWYRNFTESQQVFTARSADRFGSKLLKSLYVEFEDGTFTKRKASYAIPLLHQCHVAVDILQVALSLLTWSIVYVSEQSLLRYS